MSFDPEKYKNTLPYATRKEDPVAHEAYKVEEVRIHTQFMNDLFEDLGITRHSKRFLLFQQAWERGHSSGFYEVWMIAEDLVELIR